MRTELFQRFRSSGLQSTSQMARRCNCVIDVTVETVVTVPELISDRGRFQRDAHPAGAGFLARSDG